MQENPVRLDFSPEGLAVVTLDRPDRRNAIDEALIERLSDIFADLAEQDGVRALMLRGEGPAFCAGADLAWMARAGERDEADNLADAQSLALMLRNLAELPIPTLALVQGAAIGAGAGLVAACDLAIATADAEFCFSEVRLGLIPATVAPYVVQAIGPRHARRLFLTGERFSADEARRIGLVQEVLPDGAALGHAADRLVEALWQGAPGAQADAKHLVADVFAVEVDDHLLRDTARRLAARRVSDEGREGIAAFLGRRKPDWAR